MLAHQSNNEKSDDLSVPKSYRNPHTGEALPEFTWFKQQFKNHKLSQAELARLLNVHRSTINHIIRGKREIKSTELTVIAKFFDISIADLVFHIQEYQHQNGLLDNQYLMESVKTTQEQLNNTETRDISFHKILLINYPGCYVLDIKDNANDLAGFVKGDQVICDPYKKPSEGDFVVIQRYGRGQEAETLIRRLNMPFLVSDSSTPRDFPPIDINNKNIKIMSVVSVRFKKM